MTEFLQSYGIWIFFGLLVIMMLNGRGRGMGCCGGKKQDLETVKEEEPKSGKPDSSCH